MNKYIKRLRKIERNGEKHHLEEFVFYQNEKNDDQDKKEIRDVNKENDEERKKRPQVDIPTVEHKLRNMMVLMPDAIYEASGIKILGKRIKSLMFSTDLALISNCNADAIIAVYPFTPQLNITEAIINTAPIPVFAGIGGGTTTGDRSLSIGLHAELQGAYGVVVNSPMEDSVIKKLADNLDIPVIATVASEKDDFMKKVEAGAGIINVSGGAQTVDLVKKIRQKLGPDFPIIATGGADPEQLKKTIQAGANAITYTPPSSAEIFAEVMEEYRQNIWNLGIYLIYFLGKSLLS